MRPTKPPATSKQRTERDTHRGNDATAEVRVFRQMADIPEAAWDALVPDAGRPFLAWGFLNLLETSGSATEEKGWSPRHVTLWKDGQLVAAAPGFVKTHSMGEFFYNDFRWPPLVARFGVRYYPKLILSVPFSPATGPRLLVKPGEDAKALKAALLAAARDLAEKEDLSSVAVLFADPDDLEACRAAGFAPGAGVQFHWENRGFSNFDDFLGRFNSKRRHMVKSERAQPAKDGTLIRTLEGDALTPEVMAFASRCYDATVDKHAWGMAHLTPTFFAEVPRAIPGAVEVVVAEEAGRKLACAFNLRGKNRLFGRHWGAVDDRRYLHFNVCYYHSIERCIALGMEAFEPGAGGEHKLARGFEPTLVHSAHLFLQPRLHAVMARALEREVEAWEAEVRRTREEGLAFRSGTGRG